jgi:hypothetical protein
LVSGWASAGEGGGEAKGGVKLFTRFFTLSRFREGESSVQRSTFNTQRAGAGRGGKNGGRPGERWTSHRPNTRVEDGPVGKGVVLYIRAIQRLIDPQDVLNSTLCWEVVVR